MRVLPIANATMRTKDPYAKRALGQNFLINGQVINRILDSFGSKENDVVLEIGPGRGALTEKLIESGAQIYALEFDRDLAPLLHERFEKNENFTLVEGDALKLDLASLERGGRKLRIIANLPYNISTAILQRLFSSVEIIEDCVLMFQREVVDRLTAKPGTSERGYLTVLIEAHFLIEWLFDVPPSAFRPEPKVWSSVVRLLPKTRSIINEELFREVVGRGFAQKRKTILNNLKVWYPKAGELLESIGIDPIRRAETLSLDEWISVVARLELAE